MVKNLSTLALLIALISLPAQADKVSSDNGPTVIDEYMTLYSDGDIEGMLGQMTEGYEGLPSNLSYQTQMQLEQARQLYGKVVDYEIVGEEEISSRITQYTVIAHQEKLPTFWTFTVYDGPDACSAINFYFMDIALWAQRRVTNQGIQ